MAKITTLTLLNAVIAIGASVTHRLNGPQQTFQAYGETSAAAGAATILVEATNIENPGTDDWLTIDTLALTLATTRSHDFFEKNAAWRHVRANVTAISGTGATVSVLMGAPG